MNAVIDSFRLDFLKICYEMNDSTMFIYDRETEVVKYTYSFVCSECKKIISFFASHNVLPGDTIVTIMPNSPEAALFYFSSLLYGINYAPIPCTVTNREFDNWLQLVSPKMIIKKNGIAEYSSEVETFVCNCDGDLSWLSDYIEAFSVESNYTSNIYLMTSGTTGDPKAMSIDADILWNSGKSFINQYDLINSGVRFWNYLPMSYLGGLFNLAFIPLCCKGSFVISEPFSGKTILNFWNFIKKHDITSVWFVPSIVQGLLKMSTLVDSKYYLDACKLIKISFLGTAPISLKVKQEFEDKFSLRLYENFALSETTFLTYENSSNIRFREESSVGETLSYVSIKIAPIEGLEDVGEIWVKTPYLFNGYLSASGDVKAETDNEGYFNTHDLGKINDDGILVLAGRNRDIIKKGGLFVSLVEIESVVIKNDYIETAVAVPIKHDFYGESYYLFVKIMDGLDGQKTIEKLRLWMIDNVVHYKIPEKIIQVEDIPRTSSGKIRKNELLEMVKDKL